MHERQKYHHIPVTAQRAQGSVYMKRRISHARAQKVGAIINEREPRFSPTFSRCCGAVDLGEHIRRRGGDGRPKT
jgi:hypothetical protein